MANFEPEHCVAVCDTREQTPFNLAPLIVERGTLQVGDYSVKGLESYVSLERKSLQDLVQCCGSQRDRFQRELNSLRGWPVSAVIVEANWHDLESGEWHGTMKPRQITASVTSWIAQGHRIILGGPPETASRVARDILFFAARYRFRESVKFMREGARI